MTMTVRATMLTEQILKAAVRDELTRDSQAEIVRALYEAGDRLHTDLPSVACIFFESALEIERAVI